MIVEMTKLRIIVLTDSILTSLGYKVLRNAFQLNRYQ